jgi:transposase
MLGIDVSKDTLACTLLDPQTRSVLWELLVPNTPEGIDCLLDRTPLESSWVLEPTGRYGLMVVDRAHAAGRQVLCASPRKAKRFLQSRASRAKTDRLDSLGIGLYALSTPLLPYPVRSAKAERLHQLLRARKQLARQVASLHLQSQELGEAAPVLKRAQAALKAELQWLDRQIEQAQTDFPAMARLRAVPGIGAVTAAAVALRLATTPFGHPDQFVAYIGLDVGVRQSGRRRGDYGLTHQGDAELRRLLYLCAQASLRVKVSPFAGQYQRELAKGLCKKAAICAVARKIARLCWSLVRHGSQYDPARVYGRSPSS